MKHIIKYTLFGLGLFLIGNKLVCASNSFELVKDPNGLTYKIEKENKTVQLYFMLVEDKETKELVYCLEPGVNLSASQYEELNDWEYQKVHLSEEQKNKIVKIAYYGYGYENHQDFNYYYAAQLLIWKNIIPNNWQIYYTNHLGGEQIELFQNETAEILKLMEEDEILPTFANLTFHYNQNETLKLTDENKVLSKFEPIEKIDFLNIEENMLKINSKKAETITFQKKYQGNPVKFYLREDGQNIMRKGIPGLKEFKIHLKPYHLRLEIEKVNEEQERIPGVVLELIAEEDIFYNNQLKYQKGEIVSKQTTKKDQPIFLKNLYEGKYCVKETSAPSEYEMLEDPICFQLKKENEIQKIKLENKKKRIQLIIKKVDQNTLTPLTNVWFQIFDSAGTMIFNGLTNEFGIIELKELTPGTYKIVEIETLEDYELKKEPIYIELNGEKKKQMITVSNKKIENVPNTKENTPNMLPMKIIYKRREE